jgi:hypothetical protein
MVILHRYKWFGVLTAIEFDHQAALLAAEIDDVRADRKLPAELQIIQSLRSNPPPKCLLRICLIAT